MEIITANKEYNASKMHVELLTLGVYVFHDLEMKNLLDLDNIVWHKETPEFAVARNNSAAYKFRDNQYFRFKEVYPDIILQEPVIYCGIDRGVKEWHDDASEHLSLQVLCYQEDFNYNDGGAIEIKCYDGIVRQYYPKNGDVLVINHMGTDTFHRVNEILSDKKRVTIILKLKRVKNT